MITLQKISDLLGCGLTRHLPIQSFVSDSEECREGSIFFALKGLRHDAHKFLGDAADRGAYAAVVSKDYKGGDFGLELLYVDDVLLSLQQLARSILKLRKTKVIGVTGSVGKTTTKEFIATLLEKKFNIYKTPGTRNTQVTLPLSILSAKGDEDYLVLEMGMTHKGNLKQLVSIAPPNIVVLTPIVIGHAQFHNNLEEIAEAKCEIFHDVTEYAVIHQLSAARKAVFDNCACPNVIYPTEIDIDSPFSETHLTENFIGACEVALYLGMTKIEILKRVPLLKPVERRFVKKLHKGAIYVDDTFNANPTSMIAALQNLPKPGPGGKRIAVLGAMGELGKFSFASHQQVGRLALDTVDKLICKGEETKPFVEMFRKKGKEVTYLESNASIRSSLQDAVKDGDVVLVKGSKYHKLWEVIDYIDQESCT